jgi:multidrug efflux pump subunit AcrA (membrane-fusion protein)
MQKTELERDFSGQQQIIRKSHVFLIENERAHYTEIQTGIEEEGLVEVVSGLNPGDQVVLLGQNNLKDSMLVEIASREEAI